MRVKQDFTMHFPSSFYPLQQNQAVSQKFRIKLKLLTKINYPLKLVGLQILESQGEMWMIISVTQFVHQVKFPFTELLNPGL
jgi:hypothetical protein